MSDTDPAGQNGAQGHDGAGNGEPNGTGDGAKPPAGTDWKAEARKWEERAKANVSAAEELQKLKEAEKTEIQKAQERAQQLEKELGNERVARLRTEIASAKGVPASSLTGTTKEEMEAAADALLEWKGGSGNQRGGGYQSGASGTKNALTGREKAAAALRQMSK